MKINQQWWITENLKTIRYKDGTEIPLITDPVEWSNLTSPGYCWYKNDSTNYANTYGALYNFYTVNSGDLCPIDWHMPSDTEWTAMENFLIANEYNYDGSIDNDGDRSTLNKIAKSLAESYGWNYSAGIGTVGNTDYPAKINATRFSALPSGCRFSNGIFNGDGMYCIWWTSTEYSPTNPWTRSISYSSDSVYRSYSFSPVGISVRCLRDSSQYNYLTITDKKLEPVMKLDLINGNTIDTIIISSACSDRIINVTSIYTNTSLFTPNLTSFYLLPGESIQLTVSLNAPERETYYYDTLNIESDDPFIPLIVVPLTGYLKKDTIIDNRDGKIYKVVKIGQQWWMAENLNIGTLVESTIADTIHSDVYDNEIIEKYCIDNLADNCTIYGGFYDWNEMMNYNPEEGSRGICPSGWHIPSDDDWRILEIYLGMDSIDTYLTGFRGSYEGLELKPGGSTGFNSLYTGYRNSTGVLGDYVYCLWWTSTLANDQSAYIRYWKTTTTAIARSIFDTNYGFSVRCVKNSGTPGIFTLQDSLVAWYPFNGNANDESGNGYNGTVYGATLTTDRFGKNNSAFSFDGIDDYIKLPDKARFQPNTSYSVSFWLKTSQTSRFDLMDQRISSGSPDYYNFGIIGNEENGQISFNFPQYSPSSQLIVYNTNFNNNEWNNLLFIKDPESKNMSIYINGKIVAEKEFEDCDFAINGSLMIGKNYHNSGHFNGVFDNLRIYNRVLAGIEIDSLYHEGFLINITSNINNVSCSGKTDGSIELTLNDEADHYRFNWSTGDTTSILDSLAAGEYSVSINDENNAVAGFETFMITEPLPILIDTLDYNFINCFSDSSGEIHVTAEGGTGNFQYSLSDDNVWQEYGIFTGLYSGKYIVSIMDENECGIKTDTITIEQNDRLSALDIVGKAEAVEYELTSYSISPTQGSKYEWFVTGGNITSGQNTNALTVHWITSGTGEIKVIETTADNCKRDTARLLVIISGIFNNEINQAELIIIPNPFNESAILHFNNPEGSQYKLYIMDLSGKVLRIVDNITISEYVLEKGDLKEGLYFIELRGPNIYRGKIIIE